MVFKKDLTPIGGKRGVVKKVAGKGAAEHKPDLTSRITNRYPKTTQPPPMPVTLPTPMGPPPEDV